MTDSPIFVFRLPDFGEIGYEKSDDSNKSGSSGTTALLSFSFFDFEANLRFQQFQSNKMSNLKVNPYIQFPQSWKILEKSGHGKSCKIAKIQNFMEICLPGTNVMEKSWKSVVQIRLIMFLLCCDQCGSRLYSSVFRNTAKRSWKWIHFHHGRSWKSHGILFLNLCGNPDIVDFVSQGAERVLYGSILDLLRSKKHCQPIVILTNRYIVIESPINDCTWLFSCIVLTCVCKDGQSKTYGNPIIGYLNFCSCNPLK